MKILLQSTLLTPLDWAEHDHTAWATLPKKAAPTGGETLDNVVGWGHGLNVQGVTFLADHYHVLGIPDGVRVTIWNDDPAFNPVGMRYARVRDFLFCVPDAALGGAINTRQSQTVFAEAGIMPRFTEPAQNTTVRDWALFTPPVANVMHGIGVTDRQHDDHVAARTLHGWREWTEGLDPSELDARGRIKEQRAQGRFARALGTKTFIQRDTARATGDHATAHELAFEATTDTVAGVSESTAANSHEESFIFTTIASEPNSAAWLSGTYRCQFDTTAIGADMAFGCLILQNPGGSLGHFARMLADLSGASQLRQQAESKFTSTGLNLATAGGPNWTLGLATDRFECAVAQENNATMGGPQTLTIDVNTSDSFADGPWLTPTDSIPVAMGSYRRRRVP